MKRKKDKEIVGVKRADKDKDVLRKGKDIKKTHVVPFGTQ